MEKEKTVKKKFQGWFENTMGMTGTAAFVLIFFYLFIKVAAFLKSNFVDQGSFYLKTGIGDIQMTGLMPTLFVLFYVITLTIAFVMVLMTIRANSRKSVEKESVK